MCAYAVADQPRRWFTGVRHINIYDVRGLRELQSNGVIRIYQLRAKGHSPTCEQVHAGLDLLNMVSHI